MTAPALLIMRAQVFAGLNPMRRHHIAHRGGRVSYGPKWRNNWRNAVDLTSVTKVRIGVVVVLLVSVGARRAEAQWEVHDLAAITQRATQFTQYMIQFNEIVTAARSHLEAFREVYQGMKDWRTLGWSDILQIVDLPWFDGIEGIDDIRRATYVSVMGAQQAEALWTNTDYLAHWRSNPRYQSDPWFRAKVDSLLRQSKRAQATRAALLRQMQMQNRAVSEDVKKIKRLRDAIEQENRKSPVNQGKIASLQAEIAAVQARYSGEDLMLKNQQAIIFLVGEDEAQRAYLETRDRGWITSNNARLQAFGPAMGR